MADPIESKLVDKRVAHRYLRKGVLDEKEFEKHLKALPDLAGQALTIEASMDGDLYDDEEEDDVVEEPEGAGEPGPQP